MYTTLKLVHMIAATLTIAGFVLRGFWMLSDSEKLQHPLVRVLPHIIDTVFLLAGIGLIMTLHLPVLLPGWLQIKIAALLVYIVLGTIALKRGKTKRIRAIAFVLALLTFAYVVGVALSKSAASWITILSA
ncbi:MAG: regulator SirB [Gammaproteobacteria bacterium]|nr:MAG: regulator SirB [Gammaproteobacteria bacterium]